MSHPTSSVSACRIPLSCRVSWPSPLHVFTRIALAASYLSGIADRFGLWGKYEGYGNFAGFMRYTAQVNAFMPAFTIPFLAWAATVAEFSIGILLLIGLWQRWTAIASALLLFTFATAMTISLGLKAMLDYSVLSATAASLLLAAAKPRNPANDNGLEIP